MRAKPRSARTILPVLAAVLAVALAVLVPALSGTAQAAGLARSQVCGSAAEGAAGCAPGSVRPFVGDCERAGVTCRPDLAGSCTDYSSQTTPPATIRVFVPSDTTNPIHTVGFETYVKNVLPNEWVPSWDGDALKAGAVAVKSYAWYWVTHFGGYLGGQVGNCFDVTDDQDFQVYKALSATVRTNTVVNEVWPFVARDAQGSVLQASYRAYLNSPTEKCGAFADGTTLSQDGTQACNEASTGNKWNVILQKYYDGVQLATTQQLRTAHDFTYAQTSTRVTFANGHWVIGDNYPTSFTLGQAPGDVPLVTDDGDGFAHATIYRPSNSTWYIAGPTGAVASTVADGARGDIPVPGHWNGRTQPSAIAVFRPSNATWYVRAHSPVQWGRSTDTPVPGDYTGDGSTDIAVYRPSTSTWYFTGQTPIQWGRAGDIPVPGDYNGDGKIDIAVYRPSTSTWYVRGLVTQQWGAKGDIPVTGDYTGDGKTDFAVYRPSNHSWYVRGVAGSVAFGAAGVTPIGAAPYRG